MEDREKRESDTRGDDAAEETMPFGTAVIEQVPFLDILLHHTLVCDDRCLDSLPDILYLDHSRLCLVA